MERRKIDCIRKDTYVCVYREKDLLVSRNSERTDGEYPFRCSAAFMEIIGRLSFVYRNKKVGFLKIN